MRFTGQTAFLWAGQHFLYSRRGKVIPGSYLSLLFISCALTMARRPRTGLLPALGPLGGEICRALGPEGLSTAPGRRHHNELRDFNESSGRAWHSALTTFGSVQHE